MNKPSDFMLGLTDFFAVLLPGAAFSWLLLGYRHWLWDSPSLRWAEYGVSTDSVLYWSVFFACAYVVGHFVFMTGARLDGAYDQWRRRTKPLNADKPFRAACKLMARVNPELERGSFSPLKWCMSYVQVRCPNARLEIERLEAIQKLFRSLVVVGVAFALHFILTEHALWPALAAVGLSLLSFHRYCDQRWKMTELTYATALILAANPAGGTASAAVAASSDD